MNEVFQGLQPVHYLPILTTIFSAFFFFNIINRYFTKGGTHLLWWAIGVFTYGLGTFFEAFITLSGNTPALNKLWYIAGAILGGYPLAQDSVYLHFTKRTANLLTLITVPFIVFASVCVLLSPTNLSLLESFRPSGASLEWQWVRLLTPFINTYSAIFLIGSALWSAIRYTKIENGKNRAVGNTFITVGALLPGIGGGMAKAGIVEALYIGEFIGIILIWFGYSICLKDKAANPQLIESTQKLTMENTLDYKAMLDVAVEEARIGLAEGGIPIGAALFDGQGNLLGRGHNRRVQEDDPSIHGETDAFRKAGRQKSYRDKIMATTLAPCWYCSGLIRQFKIGTVLVGEARNFEGGIEWLKENGIKVINLDSRECVEMMREYISKNPAVWNEDIGEE